MKIKGFQKLSLIDYPGKLACSLFVAGCNFRCGFCHNPELVLNENKNYYPEDEILDFLKKRKNHLEGVCISGGEPLLSLDKNFLKKIKKLGYLIKIDTNAMFPEKIKELIDEKLADYLAVDIKSNKKNYEKITNSKIDFDKLEKSIKLASLLDDYEFRITIIEGIHTKEELKEIAIWLNKIIGKKPKRFCLQGFKATNNLLDKSFENMNDTSEKFLTELKDLIKDYFEEVVVRF